MERRTFSCWGMLCLTRCSVGSTAAFVRGVRFGYFILVGLCRFPRRLLGLRGDEVVGRPMRPESRLSSVSPEMGCAHSSAFTCAEAAFRPHWRRCAFALVHRCTQWSHRHAGSGRYGALRSEIKGEAAGRRTFAEQSAMAARSRKPSTRETTQAFGKVSHQRGPKCPCKYATKAETFPGTSLGDGNTA